MDAKNLYNPSDIKENENKKITIMHYRIFQIYDCNRRHGSLYLGGWITKWSVEIRSEMYTSQINWGIVAFCERWKKKGSYHINWIMKAEKIIPTRNR